MPDLTYRLVNQDARGYRVSFDSVAVGSISKQRHHIHHNDYWHWGVGTMPLMNHGGRGPSGDAETFDAALAAFKAAFVRWHAGLPPGLWEKNRDYIAHCAKRWRSR